MEAVTKPESLIRAALMIKRNCDAHEKRRDNCVGCPFRGEVHGYPGCVLNDTFPAVWEIEEGSVDRE